MSITWQIQAACAGTEDPEAFFLDHNTADLSAKWGPVRTICAGCPVQLPCLTAALEEEGTVHTESRFGFRGGLTPRERTELSRNKARRNA